MGILDLFKNKENNKIIDLENDRWIGIKIEEGFIGDDFKSEKKEVLEKERLVFEEWANKLGWKTYIEKGVSQDFELKSLTKNINPSSTIKGKEISFVGIEPQEGGMISPRELSKNLLAYRKVAFWVFNRNPQKSKGKVTIQMGSFNWKFQNSLRNPPTLLFVVYKPCIEIWGPLKLVTALHKKNPNLCKKAFYISLKEQYNDYLKLSKSKNESKETIKRAENVLNIFKENGYG